MNDFTNRPGGVLFKNTRKTNSNQPDKEGNIVIDPALMPHLIAEYQAGRPIKLDLSCWEKQSKSGTTFWSIASKLPFVKTAPTQQPPRPKSGNPWDDDSPF